MSQFSKREKWEVAHDAAHGNLDQIEKRLSLAFDACNWMAQHGQDGKDLAAFVRDTLTGYAGHLVTVRSQIDKLADAANPNAPEDLPF